MAPKKLPKTYLKQTRTSSKTKTRVTGGVRGKGRNKVRVEYWGMTLCQTECYKTLSSGSQFGS